MENINWYLFFKSLHTISFVAWMAGMFYLPRLYVYHCRAIPNGELDTTLQIMELKLLRVIINPAMILTFIFGVCLIYQIGWASLSGWFHAKLTLVLLLTAFHIMLSRYRKDFENKKNTHSERFFRIINEVPTIILIGIVFLAILKPF
ncbi:MAG: protoporphyrinogen oxidase HemJ [Alphaproteobacteria bacterium]|jgi:putative membrane protein|nr:protoporphyrinogen oxidase HemJ [Candidatus Jidaibacter sp.]